MKRLLAVLLACLIAAPISAGPAGQSAASTLHVDIGQVVAAGKVSPVEGLTTSGQPDAASLQVFADSGYVAVVDLRAADEDRGFDQRTAVEELGMTYVSLPIGGGPEVTFANAARLDDVLAKFDGPVLVHCKSGNRAGALLALRASLHGADDAAALALGKEAGLTKLEGVVREKLAAGSD